MPMEGMDATVAVVARVMVSRGRGVVRKSVRFKSRMKAGGLKPLFLLQMELSMLLVVVVSST